MTIMIYFHAMENLAKYDLAFSIGHACACSMTLRAAKMQFASFPLDWITGGTIATRTALVTSSFDGWMEKDDFEYLGTNPKNGLGMFKNRKTGFTHLHDFPDAPIETSIHDVSEKHRRRAQRLTRLIESSSRVLVVYLARPKETPLPLLDFTESLAALNRRFPGKDFDIIRFTCDSDRPFASRLVSHPAEHVTEILFDYRDPKRDANMELTAQALIDLGVAVKDYRSAAERKAYDLKRKMKRYGVNTRTGLFFARLNARILHMLGRDGKR